MLLASDRSSRSSALRPVAEDLVAVAVQHPAVEPDRRLEVEVHLKIEPALADRIAGARTPLETLPSVSKDADEAEGQAAFRRARPAPRPDPHRDRADDWMLELPWSGVPWKAGWLELCGVPPTSGWLPEPTGAAAGVGDGV